MRIEEKFKDVLQNIEFGIIQAYKENQKILDIDAIDGIRALIRHYEAEQQKIPPRAPKLTELSKPIFEGAKQFCELRLGREVLGAGKGKLDFSAKVIQLSDLILCLRRIEKSMKTWNKELGKRGYFDFVNPFIK